MSFSQGALYEVGSVMSIFTIKNYSDEFLSALDKDFHKIVSRRSQELFNASPTDLLLEQKIRLIKILNYSYCTTVSQLARCLAMPKEQIATILKRNK